jgi:ferric-dicitrate binding protein FerR (iron transport regulator)
MDSQRETIYQLLMLKLTDSLKESEEGYINSLIEGDPEVYALWNEIRGDFAGPHQKEALQSFDTGEMMISVSKEITLRKQRRLQKRKILFFTTAILLVAGTIGLYKGTDNKKDLSDNVVLQLGNGEQIALSDSSIDQMTDNNAIEIRSNNNTLAYIVNKKTNSTGTIIVPAGKSYRIQLSDGTEVRMNSGSKLIFPFSFSGNKREITLSGEAFLKVASDPTLPFIVHAQHTNVQVLGTSFNVNSYDSGIVSVSLVEGAVKMQSGRSEILLKPGYQAKATSKGIDTIPFEEEIDLAWLNDQYIFRHHRLDEVTPVLARWYNVQIVFDNQTAAGKIVTGHIVRSDDIKTVLDMLKIISNINYYYKEDIIHIQ